MQFKIRIETTEPYDVKEVWDFVAEIEKQTRLVIFWTLTSHFAGSYILAGEVIEPVAERSKRKARMRLSAEEIISIRRLHDGGISQADLARQFNVSQSLISLVVRRLRGAKVITNEV